MVRDKASVLVCMADMVLRMKDYGNHHKVFEGDMALMVFVALCRAWEVYMVDGFLHRMVEGGMVYLAPGSHHRGTGAVAC